MNITEEQKLQQKIKDSITNPELYGKIHNEPIRYVNKLDNRLEKKYGKDKKSFNDDVSQINIIVEIILKLLGYSTMFYDLTLSVFLLMIGEIFRIVNNK